MNLATNFHTPRAAMNAVRAEADATGRPRLSALPYNPMEPDTTTWWLSPSTDNPAYKYGKIVFTSQDTALANLFIGLYIEKGVGPSLRREFSVTEKARRGIMDETWLWHRFFNALESGDFEQQVRQVEAEARRPILIALDAVAIPPPQVGDWEADRYHLPRDFVPFSFSRGQLQPLDRQLKAGFLIEVGMAQTITDLTRRIRQIADLDWVWIDFHAGFRFWTNGGRPDFEVWDSNLIWRRAVLPWSDWLH